MQRGNMTAPRAVTVGTTATLITAAAPSQTRTSVTIYNNGASTVYLGTSGVTAAAGLPLPAGQSMEDDVSLGAWYGITSSGTVEVRVVEVV